MKKTKTQKGITLIALIITIIVLLILAVAAISAVRDSGIITYAKKATSATEMAQIKEAAQLASTAMFLENNMNAIVTSQKEYFLNELTKTFAGRVKRVGDVLIVDDKYALSVIDPDFNVEVREYNGVIDIDQLLTLSYVEDSFKIDEKKQQVTIKLNLKAAMSEEDYQAAKEEQEAPTLKEMERVVCDYINNNIDEEFPYIPEGYKKPIISNMDDYVVASLNYNSEFDEALVDEDGKRIRDYTLVDWLQYPLFVGLYNEDMNEGADVKQIEVDTLYLLTFGCTKDEKIMEKYDPIAQSPIYTENYDLYTDNLSLFVNGATEPIDTDIKASTLGTEIPKDKDGYIITQNGTYEFVIKNSAGKILAFDKITINDILQSSDYVPADGEWKTDGNGKITAYTGTNTTVTIPKYVGSETIKDFRLSGNTVIKKVIIPDTITSITQSAFSGCTSLTSVEIPNTVTSIGVEAFLSCENLKEVTIPDSVTEIGRKAFYECKVLTGVKLGNSLTTIGNSAFWGCEGLLSIEIPNSVTTTHGSMFDGCTSLASVKLSNSMTSIDGFSGCTALTSIEMPDSVKTIGEGCFSGCTNLSTVILSNSLTLIARRAFDNCTSLTSITLPDGLEEIRGNSFRNTALTSITIPDSVTKIETNAFNTATLTTIYYNSNIVRDGGVFPWGADNAVKGTD